MTKNKIKYDVAFYFSFNKKIEIKANKLIDDSTFTLAKSNILMDKHGYTRLYPRRYLNKVPHFYAPNSSISRKVSKFETDKSHNEHLNLVLNKLKFLNNPKIGVTIYSKENKKIGFDIIANVSNYEWDSEVHRICNENLTMRHDIFGQLMHLGMSIINPWVAIEIINTHFPEEETFSAMLDLSKRVPFIVMFDLLSKKAKNYFISIDKSSGTIYPKYYIYEGKVWFKNYVLNNIKTVHALEISMRKHERGLKDLRKNKN